MDLGLLLGALPDVGRQASLAADPFNPSALIAMAKHDRLKWESRSKMGVYYVHKSFTDPKSAAGSGAQLRTLRRMSFRHLRLGARHTGRYVQGRIATPGYKLTSVMMVLESEDEERTACKLAVYNLCPAAAGPAEVDRLFPVGSRVAVKEPYFKQYLDGTCGLRVDNPQDIVFLPPASEDDAGAGGVGSSDSDAWDPSQAGSADRQELCRRGNEMFGHRNYAGTLQCYQRALEAAGGADAVLLSNVAVAHLGLEQWEEAFLAARRALEFDPSHTKSRFRLARALLHLRCYGPALEHLRVVVQQEPNYKPAVELLPAAQVLAEQAQGRYSAAALLEGKPAGTSKAPAVADWVGPLEVFESPTAGRGLRATAAVAAGELLLVERALASAQAPRGATNFNFDAEGHLNRGSQQQLAGTLLHLASALALDRQRVLSLFSGAPRAAVAVPAALQPFGTEEALQAALEAARAAAAAGGGPDLLHTEAAVKYNAWGGEGGQHDPALPPAAAASGEHSCVWALLCAAHHSCTPNAHVVFATGGSLAIMRASRLIAAGEEVLVAYNEDAVWQPLGARRSLLHKWGFRCCCARCKAEEGLPLSLQREVETIAENMGDSEWPGPWRQRFREASAFGGLGARQLREHVHGRLRSLEASLAEAAAAGGSTAEQQQRVVAYGLASVLQAYRMATAFAQTAGELAATLTLESETLRIVRAVRPGCLEHVTVAAIHAVDAGGTTSISALAERKRRRQRLSPAAEAALDGALQAAKTRYGCQLSNQEAIRLLDRLLKQSMRG